MIKGSTVKYDFGPGRCAIAQANLNLFSLVLSILQDRQWRYKVLRVILFNIYLLITYVIQSEIYWFSAFESIESLRAYGF